MASVFNNSDSAESDSDESLGTVEEIIQQGGRKLATIKKEEAYIKMFDTYVKTTTQMVSSQFKNCDILSQYYYYKYFLYFCRYFISES